MGGSPKPLLGLRHKNKRRTPKGKTQYIKEISSRKGFAVAGILKLSDTPKTLEHLAYLKFLKPTIGVQFYQLHLGWAQSQCRGKE